MRADDRSLASGQARCLKEALLSSKAPFLRDWVFWHAAKTEWAPATSRFTGVQRPQAPINLYASSLIGPALVRITSNQATAFSFAEEVELLQVKLRPGSYAASLSGFFSSTRAAFLASPGSSTAIQPGLIALYITYIIIYMIYIIYY